MGIVTTTAEQRFWAKVTKLDDDDGCWLWTGSTNQKGYGQIGINGKLVTVHRYCYELVVGKIPPGLQLDHRTSCPKWCVNPAHLRPATNKQNQENLVGPQSNSTSGVRGVSWNKRDKKWQARVGHNGKLLTAGSHDTIESAEAAVVAKRLELFTHNELDRKLAIR